MRTWKWSAALLLVFMMMLCTTLACGLSDAAQIFVTLGPNELRATADRATIDAIISSNQPWPSLRQNLSAAWGSGDPDQLSNDYASGFAPTTPFSQLFGNMDEAATLKALKAAIPDLKLNWRMIIEQGSWAAWAFDLSGQFSQPLVTANGTLPPTNQPWFTTVQMIVHVNSDGKIDQEYSSADMVAMMHEAGVPGFENVKVGDNALEKSMAEIMPSTDPAASAEADNLMNGVGNGPFSIWLLSDVPKDPTSTVIYHSPYGDETNDVSEVEHKLLFIASDPVEVPAIVRQGNLIGMAYTYTGSVDFPVKFANGTTFPANHQPVQFSGVVLGQVDTADKGEAWVMFNRLDNPITTDKFPVPGATATPAAVEAGTTATPAATETGAIATPTVSSAATATCTVTAPQKVNLRTGAGTSFAVGGTLAAGQSAVADGQAQGSDGKTWYHLNSLNLWARSDIVTGDCSSLPETASGG